MARMISSLGFNKSQLSYKYLHANSTTHEFLFGAFAELVDNSRDASASRLDIFTVEERSLRGGYMLCFLDDGEGMSPQEASNIVTFGRTRKRETDSTLIGHYGNGFKSGSMRIGTDVIVFTKKESVMTCLMLSRTFHEEEKIKEIIFPLPSFREQDFVPLHEKGRRGKNQHEVEMNLILKYSPFKTMEDFFNQFQRIKGNSGTLVIIYNLKLLDNGDLELNFDTGGDILLSGVDWKSDKKLEPEKYSFRAFVAILYSEPKMKIYLQKKKVLARRFIYNLYKPRCYQYTSERFKTRSQEDSEAKLRDAEAHSMQLKSDLNSSSTEELQTKLCEAQTKVDDLQFEVEMKKSIVEKKQKALKEPKTLNFIFGVNLENRNCDGIFVYNCNRLIKMYERVGPQLKGNRLCGGIIGIVDVPYIFLEPTHNKQDFTDAKEYGRLLEDLGEYMEHYWKENIECEIVDAFWNGYGYQTRIWDEKPSMDVKYLNQRARQRNVYVQCDICLKWRILPFLSQNVGKAFPDAWTCSQNPDLSRSRCSATEEKLVISEGKFQRADKTRNEQADEITETVYKLRACLDNIRREESDVESSKTSFIKEEPNQNGSSTIYEDYSSNNRKRRKSSHQAIISALKSRKKHHAEQCQNSDYEESVTVELENSDTENEENFMRNFIATLPTININSTSSGGQTSTVVIADELGDTSSVDEFGDSNVEKCARVEVKIQNKWRAGVVDNRVGDNVLVKFDKQSDNYRFDKKILASSNFLKIADQPELVKQELTTNSSCQRINEQVTVGLTRAFSSCLQYFRPPEWKMDVEVMRALTADDLVNFPFNEFFEQYEDELVDTVNRQIRSENEEITREVERKNTELEIEREKTKKYQNNFEQTIQLIARLMNSIHEGSNLDPLNDSDEVQKLLQAFVTQAELRQHPS